MAVRSFNGSSDLLTCATGALSGVTFGTAAAIVRVNANSTDQQIVGLHNSGGTWLAVMLQVGSANVVLWHDGATSSAGQSLSNATWYLLLARKATGTATPRFSVFNYTSQTWSHQAGSSSLINHTAPGASGSIRFNFENTADWYAGYVAARGVWANTLPWTADASGDTALEAAGLHTAAKNWLLNNPSAFWLFNQSSVAIPVDDLSATGTADQTAITGTTVINGSDPPGFDFSLDAGAGTSVRRGPAYRRGPVKRFDLLRAYRVRHRDTTTSAADIRADTGLGTIGLSADATIKKIAVVAASSSLGLTGVSTAKKVAPAAGVGAAGLAANFVHVDIRPITAAGMFGLAATSTARKVTPATLNAPLGLAGIVTAKKVGKAAAVSPAGLVGIVTARKVAPATGRGNVGMSASFAHVEIHAVTALAELGIVGFVAAKKRGTPLLVGTVGFAGNTLPKKISKSTGVGIIPVTGLVVARKRQAIIGRSTVGFASWWEILPLIIGGDLFITDRARADLVGDDRNVAELAGRSRQTSTLTGGNQ